ncbi:hypothetical protein DL769_003919 [Monosporascus sp. CRB-8-3]|nr:hypothetical protein DL769_003919 [Monosporascus sp. CRB-8-3]
MAAQWRTQSFSSPIDFSSSPSSPRHTPNKTADIGQDGVSLSTDPQGRILQLSTFHAEHGIVVAVPFEQFDRSKYYDPKYVRSYRTRMLQYIKEGKGGFGLDVAENADPGCARIVSRSLASFNYTLHTPHGNLEVSYTTHVLKGGDVVQTAVVTNPNPIQITHRYALKLCLSLNRASYGQLTEGGPIPLPQSRNILCRTTESVFNVTNPYLGAQLEGSVEVDGTAISLHTLKEQTVDNAPLDSCVSGKLDVLPYATVTLRARFRLSTQPGFNALSSTPLHDELQTTHEPQSWVSQQRCTTYIIRRNVDYILGNCAIPVSNTEVAVVTDHVALPLGWNRDNYWQVRLLLETYNHLKLLIEPDSASEYAEQISYVAKGHLGWVFNRAQRPNGFWHRSYLVTGKPKDLPIFQLDQQCYPLLELCDYLDCFPYEVDFVTRLADSGVIAEILEVLASKRDAKTGLWPTDETPGDDAVTLPHHFSSHVLLWRTYARLRDLWASIKPWDDAEIRRLSDMAMEIRDRTLRSFTTHHPQNEKTMFAYLTDGHGVHTLYHDSNDVPTLFALEWKFVETPNQITTWMNTMDFSLSPSNGRGFCAEGPYRGLGSQHSPGAWVLGYFQELAYAALVDDAPVIDDVWEKILAAMQWDGTFPESVDPQTAECSSKAWFSWPGSMIGALLIRMRVNGKDRYLER